MPKWLQILGAVIGTLVGFGGVIALGSSLFRVPYTVEQLGSRVTKIEQVVESIQPRFSALEQGQLRLQESQKNIEATLLQLSSSTKAMHDTILQTWRSGVQTEEKLKSFQVYVDERLGNQKETK